MAYPNYLIHFNKLHSRKNGQFISGDGDGDGTADEHHRYSKNGVKSKERSGEDFDGYTRKKVTKIKDRSGEDFDGYNNQKEQLRAIVNDDRIANLSAKMVCTAARKAAGFAFSKTSLGKTLKEIGFKEVSREMVKVTNLDKIAKDAGLYDAKTRLNNKIQSKVAEGIKKGGNKALDQDFQLTDSQAKKLKIGLGVGGAAAVAGGTAYGVSKAVKNHKAAEAEKRSHFGIPKPETKSKSIIKEVTNNEPYTSETGKKLLKEYYDFFGDDNKKKRKVIQHGACGDFIVTIALED